MRKGTIPRAKRDVFAPFAPTGYRMVIEMKVLLVNGSPRKSGCTHTALTEVAGALNAEGVETELLWLGAEEVQDCVACMGCARSGACVIKGDVVEQLIEKAKDSDGFVIGTPVYYAHPSGRVLSVLDRAFYSAKQVFEHKPAAAVASARRAGTTASLDVINKYFTICQMPVVSSTYWNMVHGAGPEDVAKDLEGLQIMRNLGRNMAWLLKCIELGAKAGVAAPEAEKGHRTNFIR